MLIGVQRPTGGDRGLHAAFERVLQCGAWEDDAAVRWATVSRESSARLFDPVVQQRLRLADAVLTVAMECTATAVAHLIDARDAEARRKTA